MSRVSKIIAVAESYRGIIEIKPNKGFGNAVFDKKIRQVGFYTGAPWCAFFTKLVFTEAYADHVAMKAIINQCASGNAQATLKNFKANGTFATGQVPKPGAIVIWQLGSGTSGHAGIVKSVDEVANTMITIEGNTNASGSREGDRVAQKLRTIKRPFQAAGLNVLGYVYPVEI
ncbi:CHAP domain-containing protein [Pedobacter sp. PAMC26386]|nr:CHAP domain-containing protein [Pedobacter sp. PAMC26386]